MNCDKCGSALRERILFTSTEIFCFTCELGYPVARKVVSPTSPPKTTSPNCTVPGCCAPLPAIADIGFNPPAWTTLTEILRSIKIGDFREPVELRLTDDVIEFRESMYVLGFNLSEDWVLFDDSNTQAIVSISQFDQVAKWRKA